MNAVAPIGLPEGLHFDVPEMVYHSDPCEAPSLSNSIATILINQSPRHAHHNHRRLNPNPAEHREVTAGMDFGSALHKTILGRGASIEVIPYANYKKDAPQELRDIARDAGRIPLLEAAYERMLECADAALAQMKEHPDCADFFAPGRSEVVMIWKDGDTWCRSMVDRMPDD